MKDSINSKIEQESINYLEKIGYFHNNTYLTKVNQLNETLKVRFGTMIVGQTMSGKTSIINTLMNATNRL